MAGCEEREGSEEGTRYLLYLPADAAGAVEDALRAAGAPAAPSEPVPEQDWAETWRDGLEALEISARLVVRPPFVSHVAAPGQRTVVIEPGQAFGTGGHESTRLALELVDACLARRPAPGRLLDVGTGSGVLAIAALKLGAGRAVGFDLDPLAAEAARANALENGVAHAACFFAGGLEALGPGCFDLVVANLLRRELEPILEELATRVAPGGALVLAGLLVRDRTAIEALFRSSGLRVAEHRLREDADGEAWLGLVLHR